MNPLINIEINIWNKNNNNFDILIYDSDNELHIYQDDKCDIVLSKIIKIYNITYDIYGWKDNDTPMDFYITNTEWKGYNINPLLSNNKNIPRNDNYNKTNTNFILNSKKIYIIKVDDLDNKIRKYYKIDRNIQFEYDNKLIKELYYTKPAIQGTQYISKYNLYDKIDLKIDSFYDLFFNKDIQKDCIIWIKDNYKSYIKLLKKYKITSSLLYSTLESILNEIFTQETLIILYGNIGSQSIIRVDINIDGNININMLFNLRDKITFNNIPTMIQIKDDLQRLTNQNINLKEGLIKTVLTIRNNNNNIINNIHKYPNFLKKQSNIIIYNRSSFNNKPFYLDDVTYIKNALNNTDDIQLIANELQEFFPNDSLKSLIERVKEVKNYEYISDADIISKKEMTQNTTISLNIEKDKNLTITIANILSHEFEYFKFWILRIFSSSNNIFIKENKESSSKQSSASLKSSKQSSESLKSSELLKSSESLKSFSGGGGDIKIQKINILKDKDKELFNNYARSCQYNRQPMAVDIDLFKNKEFEKNVDNVLYYGSNEDKKHAFFCPRWWCPQSEIPLKLSKDKCPIEGEEKVNLFESHKGELGNPEKPKYVALIDKIKKPCCFTKLKKNVTDISSTKIDKQILTKLDPIPENRLGLLPENLHNLLLHNIDIDECSNILKKTECFYRYGMEITLNKKNTLMKSLLKVLQIQKNDFIKKIRKELTFFNFLSLEKGNICREFINNNKIDKYNEKWFPENLNIPEILKIQIYNSYENYIEYLENDDIDKNIQFLYSLISIVFNKILIVILYINNNVSILCPENTSIFELIYKLKDNNNETIILFDNKGIYEPIVLKSKTKETFSFYLNNIDHLYKSIDLCSYNDYIEVIDNLINYNNSITDHNFKCKKLLINNNLTISHFILKSNIILYLNTPIPLYYMNDLLHKLKIKDILFYDFYSHTENNEIDTSSLHHILKKFNLHFSIKKQNIYYNDAILLFTDHEITEKLTLLSIKSKKYKKLLQDFQNGKIDQSSLLDNNHNIIIDFFNQKIKQNKDYFYFTGFAFINNNQIFKKKINEYKIKNEYHFTQIHKHNYKFDHNIDMLQSNISIEKPPDKWRNTSIGKMTIIENKNYNYNSLYKLFHELIQFTKKKITINDIKHERLQNLKLSLLNKYLLKLLLLNDDFKDKIIHTIKQISKINIKKSELEKYILQQEPHIIEDYYENISTNYKLLPNILDIVSASDLLNITFFMVHNRAYNIPEKEVKRYSDEDYLTSLSIYPKNLNIIQKQPLIMLYFNSSKQIYHIIKNGDTFFYERYNDVDETIKQFISKLCI